MRIPTRYRREENQSVAMMLATKRPIDTTNCQAGGVSEAIRRNMTIGAVGGNNDAATAHGEFESFMISTIMAKLSQVGAAASGMYICNSCSVSQVEASPANSELYRR
jgi:hypothetical protein